MPYTKPVSYEAVTRLLSEGEKTLMSDVVRISARIKDYSKTGNYSEDFIERQRQEGRDVITSGQARLKRLAHEAAASLRHQAKEKFLYDAVDSLQVQEVSLFRDFTAAANDAALEILAEDVSALCPEKVLILAGELRRRGSALADLVCDKATVDPEPWRDSEYWRQADELDQRYAELDATESIAKQMDAGCNTRVMLAEGGTVRDIDTLFT